MSSIFLPFQVGTWSSLGHSNRPFYLGGQPNVKSILDSENLVTKLYFSVKVTWKWELFSLVPKTPTSQVNSKWK